MGHWATDIQNKLSELELDLEKILKLDKNQQKLVLKLFDDLMDCFYGERGMSLPGGEKIDYLRAEVLYKTLVNNDYLVTRREKNLNKVLEK
jgi:hypothetical protein